MALSTEVVAILDRSDSKTVRCFDVATGKALSTNVTHKTEVVQIALNQSDVPLSERCVWVCVCGYVCERQTRNRGRADRPQSVGRPVLSERCQKHTRVRARTRTKTDQLTIEELGIVHHAQRTHAHTHAHTQAARTD